MEERFQEIVINALSYHDVGKKPEAVYHAFMLGLLAQLGEVYQIESNVESGFGRADVLMIPKTENFLLGYVIELKSLNDKEDLNNATKTAEKQILEKQYEARVIDGGCLKENVRKLSIAVKGKVVSVVKHR